MKYKRIFLLVLDSLGIGAAHDADIFGDGMANTLEHVLEETKLEIPNLKSLGLLDLLDDSNNKIYSYYTKASPNTSIKSTLLSHLEMMDVIIDKKFQKFDIDNIAKDLLQLLHTEIGRKFIITDKDSDQNIVNDYGALHIKTGDIIINYDSYVLKIYAHESLVPPSELLKIGSSIMNILFENNYLISKIETVSFSGKMPFTINKNKGYVPILKPNETILERLKKKGLKIITVGKSTELFSQYEMTNVCKTTNDLEAMKKLIKATSFNFNGVCIANLSDLNKCGHHRDVNMYAKILKGFDNSIPLLVGCMRPDDLLIITSDQGNDPTYTGNDHTREKVPVLVFNTTFKSTEELPYLQKLSDIGATIADNFKVKYINGKSFLERLK